MVIRVPDPTATRPLNQLKGHQATLNGETLREGHLEPLFQCFSSLTATMMFTVAIQENIPNDMLIYMISRILRFIAVYTVFSNQVQSGVLNVIASSEQIKQADQAMHEAGIPVV